MTINVTPASSGPDFDLNDDTVVDRKDLAILVHKFGNSGIAVGTANSGDLDADGKVGVKDAILLRNNITGEALSPAAAVVVSTPAARGVDAVVRTNTNVRLQARARQVARDTSSQQSVAPSTQTAQSLRARRSTVRSASAVDQVFGSNS